MSPELLFPRPGREFLSLMAELPLHLDAALPLRRQHRRELPGDIRELSHLLTDERGDLRRDYLADPAALSAYMRYFLPWNIHRLGILFTGLGLDPGGDDPEAGATIIDLGTGPLTAPLALWMARPHLRRRKLHFVCVDRAPKPMRLGLEALTHMAQARGEGLAPWKVTLVKSPLDARLREKGDLIIMANALNEVLRRGEGVDLAEDAGALAWHLGSMLTERGQILVVEPGVRPSAHLLAALRRGLLHEGLSPLAPCPHTGPCPMSGRGYTAWCHFNFESESAPAWLRRLSELARLTKENVSLSFLHVSKKGRSLAAAEGKSLVRAVSGPFELPGPSGPSSHQRRYGQYACSERGLTLLSLPRKHLVPLPGTLMEAAWPAEEQKDAKSGAVILPLGDELVKTAPKAGAKGLPETEPREPQAPKAEKPLRERKPPKLPSERGPRAPAPKKPADRKPTGSNGESGTLESKRPAAPRPGSGKPKTGKPGAKPLHKKPAKPGAPKKNPKGRADR